MAHVGGVSTLFGTQRIITGQWVRLDKLFRGRTGPFSRHCGKGIGRDALPLSGTWRRVSFPRSAWECRLRRSASTGPGRGPQSGQDGIPTQSVGTSDPISLPQCPFSRPIMPRYPLGSFARRHWLRLVKRPHRPNWLRSGMAHVGGVSTLFGTQRIITGQWVRLDKLFHG